jgi:hypothetical protein
MVLDGRAKPVLLETYSDERLPVARRLVWITEIGTRVFNSTNPVVHALRVRMAPRALARARVQNAAAAMFGQLSARYRGMAAGGRAGQRVPDVDGLYDQLDLAAMTLFTDDGSVLAAARRWSEVVTTRAGRSADGWMLVRPDGYLAASGADAGALERFLRHWFVDGDASGNR